MQGGFPVIRLTAKNPYFYTLFIRLGDFGVKSQISAIKQFKHLPGAHAQHAANVVSRVIFKKDFTVNRERFGVINAGYTHAVPASVIAASRDAAQK
jgi:hypothetical protein